MLTIGSRIDCSVGYYEEALKFLPKTVSRNEDLGCMRRCYVQASCEPSSHRSPIALLPATPAATPAPVPLHTPRRKGTTLASSASAAGDPCQNGRTFVTTRVHWSLCFCMDRISRPVRTSGVCTGPIVQTRPSPFAARRTVTAAIMAFVCANTPLACHRSFAPPKMGHCNQHQVPSRTLVWSGPSALFTPGPVTRISRPSSALASSLRSTQCDSVLDTIVSGGAQA